MEGDVFPSFWELVDLLINISPQLATKSSIFWKDTTFMYTLANPTKFHLWIVFEWDVDYVVYVMYICFVVWCVWARACLHCTSLYLALFSVPDFHIDRNIKKFLCCQLLLLISFFILLKTFPIGTSKADFASKFLIIKSNMLHVHSPQCTTHDKRNIYIFNWIA